MVEGVLILALFCIIINMENVMQDKWRPKTQERRYGIEKGNKF